MAVKSSWVSLSQGEMTRELESLSKGQHTKFSLQSVTLGSSRGRESGLEALEKSLGVVALGRKLKDQPPGSLC